MPTPITGHNTTLAFTTSSFVADHISITPEEITRGELDTSHLITNTDRTFVPEDLIDNGGFTAEFFFDPDMTVQPPISAAAETITISIPISGMVNDATIAGSGFLTGWTPGQLESGELMRSSLRVKWNGKATLTVSS